MGKLVIVILFLLVILITIVCVEEPVNPVVQRDDLEIAIINQQIKDTQADADRYSQKKALPSLTIGNSNTAFAVGYSAPNHINIGYYSTAIGCRPGKFLNVNNRFERNDKNLPKTNKMDPK